MKISQIILLIYQFSLSQSPMIRPGSGEIGKWNRDGDECAAFFPTGRLKNWIDIGEPISPERCDDFLAIKNDESERFFACESSTQNLAATCYNCTMDGKCNRFPFFNPNVTEKCKGTHVLEKSWIGFANNTPLIFGVSQCASKESPTSKQYYVFCSESDKCWAELDEFSGVHFAGSFFYDRTERIGEDDRRRVFFFRNSIISDNSSDTIMFGYDMLDNKLIDVSVRVNLKIEQGKSINCTRSNDFGGINIACENKETNNYYLFNMSVGHNISLKKHYAATKPVIFDSEMVGINFFRTEYPVVRDVLVMRSNNNTSGPLDSWYLVMRTRRGKPKPPKNCYMVESEEFFLFFDSHYFCPLSIPASSTLKYVSVANDTLWLHTISGNKIKDEPFHACHLLNDCYGCLFMPQRWPYKCIWKNDECSILESGGENPANVSECLKDGKVRFYHDHIVITQTSFCLQNDRLSKILKLNNGKIVDSRIQVLSCYSIKFNLTKDELNAMEKHLTSTLFLVRYHTSSGNYIEYPIKLVLDGAKPPVEETSRFWYYVAALMILILITLWLLTSRSKRKEVSESPERPEASKVSELSDSPKTPEVSEVSDFSKAPQEPEVSEVSDSPKTTVISSSEESTSLPSQSVESLTDRTIPSPSPAQKDSD